MGHRAKIHPGLVPTGTGTGRVDLEREAVAVLDRE